MKQEEAIQEEELQREAAEAEAAQEEPEAEAAQVYRLSPSHFLLFPRKKACR